MTEQHKQSLIELLRKNVGWISTLLLLSIQITCGTQKLISQSYTKVSSILDTIRVTNVDLRHLERKFSDSMINQSIRDRGQDEQITKIKNSIR